MTEEFNLSKERKKLFNPVFLPLNGYDKKTIEEISKFVEMQDREFIKLEHDLLMRFMSGKITIFEFWDLRKKLVGKGLVE